MSDPSAAPKQTSILKSNANNNENPRQVRYMQFNDEIEEYEEEKDSDGPPSHRKELAARGDQPAINYRDYIKNSKKSIQGKQKYCIDRYNATFSADSVSSWDGRKKIVLEDIPESYDWGYMHVVGNGIVCDRWTIALIIIVLGSLVGIFLLCARSF
jgi:hypothetical protein